jgi:hypothetical protein
MPTSDSAVRNDSKQSLLLLLLPTGNLEVVLLPAATGANLTITLDLWLGRGRHERVGQSAAHLM